jgi:hypothetical protein
MWNSSGGLLNANFELSKSLWENSELDYLKHQPCSQISWVKHVR